MSKLIEFIQSEPVVALIAFLATYFGNSLVTFISGFSKKKTWVIATVRWLHGVTGRVIEAVPVEEKLAKRITLGSLFVAFLVLPGCAGTFEEARLAQPGALQASPVRVASGRCVALSDREYWFGVASVGAGSTGLGAVITAIPASDKFETSLVIAGASAAAVSVVSGIASQKAGTQYVKEGCAK